jgi:hypothetical protein
MPQHTAERLCLSGTPSLIDSRLRLERGGAAAMNKMAADGKPEAYRLVLRQSRSLMLFNLRNLMLFK